MLSNPPTTELLFPNLCSLRCPYTPGSWHLLHLPFPSLTSLSLSVPKPHTFHDVLASFSEFSPNIKRISLKGYQFDIAFSKNISGRICHWRNLQTVYCPLIPLDADALLHLSRIPALTKLHFSPSATLPGSRSPLTFSNLHYITLRSESLEQISQFLCHIRLPAITNLNSIPTDCPSRQELSSFLIGVQTSMAGNTIKRLRLRQPWHAHRKGLILGFEDLRPYMGFRNLRRIDLQIQWKVHLTESDLLTLTSAWPRLEKFYINSHVGWGTRSGITPNGLLQLLRTCRSLTNIALVMDTRGYTEFLELPESLRLRSRHTLAIHVLDSYIEAESVPAVAALFAAIAPRTDFTLSAWHSRLITDLQGWKEHQELWDQVFRQAKDVVSQRS